MADRQRKTPRGGPVKRERYEQPTFSFVNDAAR